MNKLLPCLLLGFIQLFTQHYLTQAQNIPLGTWRTHASYQFVKSVAVGGNRVYAASNNGFFYLDKTDQTLNILSKVSGLSDTEISEIAYNEALQTLVIAYQNGNLDLLKTNEIVNIPLIKNNQAINTSRQTNHILMNGNDALLSLDFGVVVLDVARNEVKATYQNLGVNGRSIAIRGATVSQDSIYLATENGIYFAPFNDNVNLQDFNNWQRFENTSGIDTLGFQHIISFQNRVYVARGNNELYVYNHNQTWSQVTLPTPTAPNTGNIRDLNASSSQLAISLDDRIYLLDASNQVQTITNARLTTPQASQYDADGNLWIGDAINGLVQRTSGNFQSFFPNGPARAQSQFLGNFQNQIITLSGGYLTDGTPQNSNAGWYLFETAQWKNFNAFDPLNSQSIADIKDFSALKFNSNDQKLYLGSYQSGLYTFENNTLTQVTDAPLVINTSDNTRRVTSIAVDVEGRLWVTNPSNDINKRFLHRRDSQGNWESIIAPATMTGVPRGVITSFSGYLWMRLDPLAGNGIWVYDPSQRRSKILNSQVNNGNLPSTNVYSLVEDKEGQIWVGTDRGVAVFFNPGDAFQSAIDATKPIFDGQNLLRAETVNTIAVDGGNRKWMGTNNGLWLFNPDGTQLVNNFTTKNSPLPSDVILDIAIQPQTGEVFIATDKGVVSYRGTATEGTTTHQTVKVFPNPVRPNYTGLVGISGLVANARVKITDTSGKLIYQTQAQGGTVSWDLRDYTGFRAKSGIYLIFSTNSDGTETFVTKIAVLE
ncbi:hypothetical protein BKI52_39660 [marine bacterium AO1-C]|nr:hypothetical protein BKI52_39660 [marine bacterium AO1-C]